MPDSPVAHRRSRHAAAVSSLRRYPKSRASDRRGVRGGARVPGSGGACPVRSLLPPRPVRRVIIDPLWLPIGAALIVLLGAAAVVGAAVAPLAPRRRLLRLSMLGLVYLALDVSLLVSCCYLWMGKWL